MWKMKTCDCYTHTHTDLHLPQRLWSYQVSYRWWVGVIKTLMSDKKKRSSLHDKMLARRCRHHAFSDLWPLHQSFIVEAKIKKMGGKKSFWEIFSYLKNVTESGCLTCCLSELSALQPATLEMCYLIKKKKIKAFISTRWNRTHLDGGTLTPLSLWDGAIRMQTHAGAGYCYPIRTQNNLFFPVCVCVCGGWDGWDCVSGGVEWISKKQKLLSLLSLWSLWGICVTLYSVPPCRCLDVGCFFFCFVMQLKRHRHYKGQRAVVESN